jgi:Fic family protein
MRTFQETHPWIKFEFDPKQADSSLWLALGEVHSKCEHIAGVPLRPQTARELLTLYLARGIRATTAIEGNTLSEAEVLSRIEGKRELPPSKEYLGVEIDNILRVYNRMVDDIVNKKIGLPDVETICSFNREVLRGLELQQGIIPGTIRKHGVGVGLYRGAPPEDCEYLLNCLSEWIRSKDFPAARYPGVVGGILTAVVAHIYFEWIHPFGDGNGRTGRLIELQILLESGVPQPAAHLLSNHYNATRTEYYRQLEQASINGGDILPFIQYAVQGFVDGLREQLKTIRGQQWSVTWHNYIFRKFQDKDGKTAKRKRQLMLALSDIDGEVLTQEINRLTPELALAYRERTSKTLTRDLNDLKEMDLIEWTRGKVRAKKETILAFLPLRREGDNLT